MHVILLILIAIQVTANDEGAFARSLWLLHFYGTEDASHAESDSRIKGALAKALANDRKITRAEIGALMDSKVFSELADKDEQIDAADVTRAVAAATPPSRERLIPSLRNHADYLSTTFDMIDEPQRAAGDQFARWIVDNYKTNEQLNVVVICTGNSRRSILGSCMGNLAAVYYGLDQIRFFSGGTAPSAFNQRTVDALKASGFSIESTGAEAQRGEPNTANPIYRVSWGQGFQTSEFSKHYADDSNPQSGFAALLVCSEADTGCPTVKGAAFRLSLPYLDPKAYDGGSFESAKYAERRDDIGRLMLSVMCQTRRALETQRAAR